MFISFLTLGMHQAFRKTYTTDATFSHEITNMYSDIRSQFFGVACHLLALYAAMLNNATGKEMNDDFRRHICTAQLCSNNADYVTHIDHILTFFYVLQLCKRILAR